MRDLLNWFEIPVIDIERAAKFYGAIFAIHLEINKGEGFSSAITDREAKGEQVRSTFVGIDSAAIVGAELLRSDAQVTVRFVSQIVSSTHAADGTLVEGDPEQVAEVTDVWTFARDVRSKDPNWKLVATEAGA